MDHEKQVLMAAQDRLDNLVNATHQLEETLKYLQLNTTEVKSSIQSNVSRLLESLRSREIWLLSQVDVVLQAKQEIIRSQADLLNKTVGYLSSFLSSVEKGNESEFELNEFLCSIEDVETHPMETPHMSFRSDFSLLRRAIYEFGRIDSRGLPLEAFASPNSHSSSLPKPFEDYEDEDQQSLTKTFLDIQMDKDHHSDTCMINFRLPAGVCPVTKNSSAQQSQHVKNHSTSCGLQQWLSEIMMEEEDGYEMVTSEIALSSSGGKRSATHGSFPFSVTSKCTALGMNLLECSKNQSKGQEHWLIRDGNLEQVKGQSLTSPPVLNPMGDYLKKMNCLSTDHWLAAGQRRQSSQPGSPLERYSKSMSTQMWLSPSSGDSHLSENPVPACNMNSLDAPTLNSPDDDQQVISSSLFNYLITDASHLSWLESSKEESALPEIVEFPALYNLRKILSLPNNHWLSPPPGDSLHSEAENWSVLGFGDPLNPVSPDVPNLISGVDDVTESFKFTNLEASDSYTPHCLWLKTPKEDYAMPDNGEFTELFSLKKISSLPISHWLLPAPSDSVSSLTILNVQHYLSSNPCIQTVF